MTKVNDDILSRAKKVVATWEELFIRGDVVDSSDEADFAREVVRLNERVKDLEKFILGSVGYKIVELSKDQDNAQ